MHPRKHSCGWTNAILVMTTVKRRREVMLDAVLIQQQRWSSEELLFLPKYFIVKKSSTTFLNHCHRKLHSGNHCVKACESLQRDNYNFFQLHPADIVYILVKTFASPAINVTSIHVIGWVLPLCREI